MKVYCINLDRRPDRLKHMSEQLSRLEVPFVRISAVDGLDPNVATAAESCGMGFTGFRMRAGAYACFQSHREFWRRLISSGEPHAMVLEDDLVIASGFSSYLLDGWVPADADIVKLETYEVRIHLDRGLGYPAGPRKLFRLRSRHAGTGCYIISRVAAQSLLEQTSGILNDPIDEYMFSSRSPCFGNLVIYQMVPAPVIQGDRWQSASHQPWIKTSISVETVSDQKALPETFLSRLTRRMKAERKAFFSGTRYVVAKHG